MDKLEGTTIVGDLLKGFIAVVPNIVGAIVIIIIGLIIARIVAKFVRKILSKSGVDKLGAKLEEIDMVDKANIKVVPSTIVSKILYYFMMLIFIVAGTDVLGVPAVSELFQNILYWIPNFITALIVLVLGFILAEAFRKMIKSACESIGIPSANLISAFIFYFVLINVIVSALKQAKVNTDFVSSNLSILIGGAVLAFAIGYGFASKDIVANIISSLYNKDRFQIGDRITVDGETGDVVEVGRSTITLQTSDGQVLIPLKKVTTEKVKIHNNN